MRRCPTAEALARAFVVAAAHTGERPWLQLGRLPLRGRWLVFEALVIAGVDWARARRLCAVPPQVERGGLGILVRMPWWRWPLVTDLAIHFMAGLD